MDDKDFVNVNNQNQYPKNDTETESPSVVLFF